MTYMRLGLRESESSRLRASVRALVPAVVTFVLVWIVLSFVARSVLDTVNAGTVLSVYGDVLFRWLPVLVVAVWLVFELDRQSPRTYGFNVDRRWARDLVAGSLVSLVSFGFAWTVGIGRGTVAVKGNLQPTVETWGVFALIGSGLLVSLLVQTVYEEFVYRAIMISNLAEGARARGLSARWAIVGATATGVFAFGLYHLPRGVIVAVDSMFIGIAFAVPYLLTGNLALSIGVHLGRHAGAFFLVGDGLGGSMFLENIGLVTIQSEGFALFAVVWIAVVVVLVTAWVRATRGEIRIPERVYRHDE